MIDGNPYEFADRLLYGDEMEFLYKGKTYFAQGWYKNGLHYLELVHWPKEPGEPVVGLWEYSSTDRHECAEMFLKQPFFDGKTFWEVEQEITWVD